MPAMEDLDAPASERSWVLNSEARVLANGDEVLIRLGGVVTRCAGNGVATFVSALLDNVDDGRIDLRPSEMDVRRAAKLEQILDQLMHAGLLIELGAQDRGSAPDPVVFGLWQRAGGDVEREDIAGRLRTREVGIVGNGALADALRVRGREVGLRLVDLNGDAAVIPPATVVVGGHEEDAALEQWNRRALDAGPDHPWLAVLPYDGQYATVGPWVVPTESACYQCFRLRRAAAFPDEVVSGALADARSLGPGLDQASRYPGLNLVQVGLVIDRLVEYVGLDGQGWQSQPGGLVTIAVGPSGIDIDRHRVLRVPRCPRCSPASGRGYPQVWFGRPVDGQPWPEAPNGEVPV